MSDSTKDKEKDKTEEVPDVSGGYVDGPIDGGGCTPGPTWPPNDGDIPGYPQNPFGPGGPYTDPSQVGTD
ncbi:hypothetical protein [Usitatibacter palustris]|uniref:Uncharacterized protein n=1 Tax=Usitatibacter palustris TaxID=2732487 RepID=A0A6M4HEX5_9PROT|nr:hypothetical protein [Usitatibacter palustris]QJR16587.1 hypothetical protein DSM104440_03422 [Usitatibacter palustris]